MTNKPNYILFITDQQRFDHLGCNGHPVLKTPHIDEMAAQGVNHQRAYVASPVCMPNRASLMTCRMPSSHGTRSLGIPLAHENTTFVQLLAAAGYDTCLIGKSHLQNLTDWPVQFEQPRHREGYIAPPDDLAVAIQSDLDNETYQYERQQYWNQPNPQVPLPFYGFNDYISILRHGFNTGGDHLEWLKENAPETLALRGRDKQFSHSYTVPQAIRTMVPEAHYSTSYIADRAAEWLSSRRDNPRPFFLMVSFPDPHHPFTPPGKYWDMYEPDDMPLPLAYQVRDWDPPEYVKVAERDRARYPDLGQMAGYSLAVTKREALEARALTCGMISMIDDAVGQIRTAAQDVGVTSNTVQIYTSDHGDHLGDHRLLFKGAEQYDCLTHVPLIWADPKGEERGCCTTAFAQTHDIGMTILEHAKIEPAVGMQGVVLPVIGGEGRDAVHIQYETQRTQESFGIQPRVHTIIQSHWRLSMYLGECQNELFDLESDPGEMTNLWESENHQSIKAQLIEKLAEMEIAAANRVPLATAQA